MSGIVTNVWTFGNGNRISFSGGNAPLVDPNDHQFSTPEGCASISDASGNLLFYTDGVDLWDGADAPIAGPPLGGAPNSAHSAVIVPPAGGGTHYHIFATPASGSGPILHTPISVAGGAVTRVANPTPIVGGPALAGEQLAVTSHIDCDKYWLVSSDGAPGTVELQSFLVDSDAGVNPVGGSSIGHVHHRPDHRLKFSPSGTLLACAFGARGTQANVLIYQFDRSNGSFVRIKNLDNRWRDHGVPYGIEFSPDETYLYITTSRGKLHRYLIAGPNQDVSQTDLIWTNVGALGALQLARDGKIYGVIPGTTHLFAIEDPNNPTATSTGVSFRQNALDANGSVLTLNQPCELGLPTFTRLAIECRIPEDPPGGDDDETCEGLSNAVDEELWDALSNTKNPMDRCADTPAVEGGCRPFDTPELQIASHISWGDSNCDCIESDDTEIMYLTLCNPYDNIALSNVTVQQVKVLDASGNPVPTLPDGSPSVQLVPIGPYCFGDLAPCACMTRQFVLRLRGAVSGPYRIEVKGICFDAELHGDLHACFTFEVCKDA